MKFLILFIILFTFSCNTKDSDKKIKKEQQFDCNSLTDKKLIYKIAKSIINKHDNENIWNLSEIDTTTFFTTEDFFTSPTIKNRLVLIGGNAGLSSGTADNLLMLFSCSDSLKVLWSGQIGDFKQSDIQDVNGDGIKEIVCKSSLIWMGACNDSYDIFNFKDSKQHFIFEAHSRSVVDCGFDNLGDLYKQGDTLEKKLECSLIRCNEKKYNIQQIQTTKIHNGGRTDDEIIKNLKVIMDTVNIKLK